MASAVRRSRHRTIVRPTFSWTAPGRELGSEHLSSGSPWHRVVVCLNVWNDLPALRESVPLWMEHVDHVIAVDGVYDSAGVSEPLSTDGTREFLQSFPKVQLLDCGHRPQIDKRNLYLAHAREGDLIFVVDADEFVTGAKALRAVPPLDVGWIRMTSKIYAREYGQPRLFRWMSGLTYRGRHHWMYVGEQLLTSHQYGGPAWEHRVVPIAMHNHRGLGHSAERAAAKAQHMKEQAAREIPQHAAQATVASDRRIGRRESIMIAQYALYDAGLAPSRLHTAVNRTTPHSSVLFKVNPGPFEVPAQYHTMEHTRELSAALQTADIVHFHIAIRNVAKRTRRVVLHHHGSVLRKYADKFKTSVRKHAPLQLVSNLELLSYGKDLHFLPNPVPVARYLRLRTQERVTRDEFVIVHTPSKRSFKGTEEFLRVCDRLAQRGIPVRPLLVENTAHARALQLKAQADACFDSFWLGIQCSGIEAGAMGLPVIAGDDTVAKRYTEHFGGVPYTFANTEEQLESVIEKLATDQEYCAAEAQKVHQYVVQHHDESAVALKYLDLLDERFGWRSGWRA
jgi:hypothetical protein